MSTADQEGFSQNSKVTGSVQTLIIGRLLAIFVLLVASWIWNAGRLKLSVDEFPPGLFIVFVISVGLTIVYFFLLRLSDSYAWQIRIQFLLDALLITWLVARTGDLTSPYLTLYIVIISVSSIFLKPRETLLFATICGFLFTLLSILAALSIFSSVGMMLETGKIVQIISFHDVAFFVVGLLAARLSERKLSGEKLRETAKSLANLRALHERIVESIRSGLITTDLEGGIFTFNYAAEEITGFKSAEMIGQSIYSLFGEARLPAATSSVNSQKGKKHHRLEIDFAHQDGIIRRIGYGVSPLFSESGEETGLIFTFQDLTDIRTMEESIRRKDRLAAVGRVAAGLAHEIRNPLGAMRGAIQVLESKTPPDSAGANLMEIILRESDRLNKIITNFLTYARPRVSNFSEIDVRETITDTFTLLRHSPDVDERHRLETILPDHPVVISADPTQVKQIFWNLARNAVLAMPDGGRLTVRLQELENDRIRILFEDTGCGMLPEQVEQLFEPFANSTTGGTGLGLSIVYQIVRDHSGKINVRSAKNKGTTITLDFPGTSGRQPPPVDPDNGGNAEKGSRLGDFLTVEKGETENSS